MMVDGAADVVLCSVWNYACMLKMNLDAVVQYDDGR